MTWDENDNLWQMIELTWFRRSRRLDMPSFNATLQPSFCLLPLLHFGLLVRCCLLLRLLGRFGFGWWFGFGWCRLPCVTRCRRLCLFFCLFVHVCLSPSLPSLFDDFLCLAILLFWISCSSTGLVVAIPVIRCFGRWITSLLWGFSTGQTFAIAEAVFPFNKGTVYLMMVRKWH